MKWVGIIRVGIFWVRIFQGRIHQGGVWWVGIFWKGAFQWEIFLEPLKCMSHDSQTYKECKNVRRRNYVFECKRVTDFAFRLEKILGITGKFAQIWQGHYQILPEICQASHINSSFNAKHFQTYQLNAGNWQNVSINWDTGVIRNNLHQFCML